jgi:hypothetical protein
VFCIRKEKKGANAQGAVRNYEKVINFHFVMIAVNFSAITIKNQLKLSIKYEKPATKTEKTTTSAPAAARNSVKVTKK